MEYRKSLPEPTPRIRSLPINSKGYPIPFFVSYVNGLPDFRMVDEKKYMQCVANNVCYICGQPMGRHKSFVAGSLMLVNKMNVEPPMHHDCATYAVKACPFMLLPKSVRRTAGMPEEAIQMQGIQLPDNPGVAVIYTVPIYRFTMGQHGAMFHLPDDGVAEWYTEGRLCTREEAVRFLAEAIERMRTALDPAEWDAQQDEVKRRHDLVLSRHLPA
jgi:hypothetical protein